MLRKFGVAAAILCIALVVTLVFLHLLGSYWHFYHLWGPGMGLGLVYVVLPASLLIALSTTFLTHWVLQRRGSSLAKSLSIGAFTTLILFALLVAGEVWRTTELRSGEGEGAGDLAPYLLYHFRR